MRVFFVYVRFCIFFKIDDRLRFLLIRKWLLFLILLSFVVTLVKVYLCFIRLCWWFLQAWLERVLYQCHDFFLTFRTKISMVSAPMAKLSLLKWLWIGTTLFLLWKNYDFHEKALLTVIVIQFWKAWEMGSSKKFLSNIF